MAIAKLADNSPIIQLNDGQHVTDDLAGSVFNNLILFKNKLNIPMNCNNTVVHSISCYNTTQFVTAAKLNYKQLVRTIPLK